jgi:nuclear GTP-binding protein
MDADYDFKVDYQMEDASAADEDGESNGAHADDEDGGDEAKDNEPMTGVDDA